MYIMLGVAMLALYTLAVPLAALITIYKQRAKIGHDEHFKRIFGFLYDGYKVKYCYW